MYSEKFLKTIKLLTSPFLAMFLLFYMKNTRREIGHSKGTPRSLEGNLGTRGLEGHMGTWALKALEYLSTRGTPALEGQLGTRDIWAFRHLRHFI